MRRATGLGVITALLLSLTACGGGGISSTPAPVPAPSPTPTPTPTPTPSLINYDSSEYRRSNGLPYHGAITAYQAGANGAGVTVGVVDSGLADPNGEFAGRISPHSRDFAGNASYQDVSGHGTAVSAVIAASRDGQRIMGMAWGATVMALRTEDRSDCDADGCTHPTSAIADAIDHGWRNGARIINVSLGGGAADEGLREAIGRATAAGTIIVIAAGNNADGEAPMVSPGDLAQSFADPANSNGLVLIAASVDADDTVSSFSAGVRGFETVSLAALGNRVLTFDQTGTDYLYTGTSFAAPQISGAAALLAGAFPNLTGRQIVDLLLESARDVGAPGADARYGVGILDVAAAFAPRGTLSLAGSGLVLAPAATSQLSGPMGDAQPAAIDAVALDDLRRAYRVDLTPSFARRATAGTLTASLDVRRRHVETGTQALRLAVSLLPARGGATEPGSSGDLPREEDRARLLSGTLTARLSSRASMMLGLRTGYTALERRIAGRTAPSFLIADHGFDADHADMQVGSAIALAQEVAPGLTLTGGLERGAMIGAPHHRAMRAALTDREARYRAASLSLGFVHDIINLSAGATVLDEDASALGARFAPILGAQAARSLFARFGAGLSLSPRFGLSANVQRGWTRAIPGGVLREGGSLVSQSWSIDLARRDSLTRGDMLALRVSQPLRVIASRFSLTLPDRWDWQAGLATERAVPLDLVPRGRQRDYELSYGRALGRGWLGVNAYLREQGGNIAAAPLDAGAAIRWSIGF